MGVRYRGSGTRSRNNTADPSTLQPGIPAGVSAGASGDLMILRYGHANSAAEDTATYILPAGWTPRYEDSVSTMRHWVAYRVSDGTESGTINVQVSGANAIARAAQIDLWTGVQTTDNGGIYDGSLIVNTTVGVTDASVTTTADDVAVNAIHQSAASSVIGDFTGETTDWIMQVDGTANAPKTGMCYASVNAATNDGGTYSQTNAGAYIVRGFALARTVAVGAAQVVPWWPSYQYRKRIGV